MNAHYLLAGILRKHCKICINKKKQYDLREYLITPVSNQYPFYNEY